MANYHNLKNAAILTPTGSTDLGSDANRYSNVYMSGNIVMSNGVTVTSTNVITPKISAVTYPDNDTAADAVGGQTITITGSGFNAGASVLLGTTPATVVTVVSGTSITFTSPALAAGNYALYVINSDGGTAIYIPGIAYSGTPTWSTSSGSLATVYEAASISSTVVATGDATISYSLNSGTLPTGSTLNSSTGLISGTAPASAGSTTYSFVIRATDGQNQDTNRSFTITVNTDAVTWVSPADNTTTIAYTDSAIANVTMSATSAAGKSITYTANALPTGLSISGANIIGTPTVIANTSSLITATASTTNKVATRTFNWVVSVTTDTYFKYTTLLLNGETTVTPFISDISTNNFALTINGDTEPVTFNPYRGDGYYSNYFDGTGDFLTAPVNAAWNFTGDWTFECWVYPTAITGFHTFLAQWGAPDNKFIWKMNSSGRMYLENLSTALTATSTTIVANQWQHIALTRSNDTIRMFVNGVLDATTATRSGTYYSAGAMKISANDTGANESFIGYMSNMRILNGTALYTTTFTPPTSPLTAITNTSLLTCQSNRFIDKSTNNFTLTKAGDTLVSPAIPFTQNSSYSTYGSAYFDGTYDYLTVATNNNLKLGSSDFTIEGWWYVDARGSSGSVLGGMWGASNRQWIISYTTTGTSLGFAYSTTGSNVVSISATYTMNLKTWYHIAAVRNGNTLTLYVNGTSVATGSMTGVTLYASTNPTYIGVNNQDIDASINNYSTNGYISDFRIVKGTAVYTSNFTPPTTPLTAVANTQLLTCQYNGGATNQAIIDNSNFNNIITRNGNVSQGTFSPYSVTGWSNYFDGNSDWLQLSNNNAFLFGSGDFTLECWLFSNKVASEEQVLMNVWDDYSTVPQAWDFRVNSNGKVSFQIDVASADTVIFISNATLLISQWYHLAVTRSGNTFRLFINGTLDSTTTNSSTISNGNGPLCIGGYTGSNQADKESVNGYLSNVRIVKGTALYTAAFTPSTTPLTAIANTVLLTCQSNRFIDNSPNSFTLTRTGDVSVQALDPFGSIPEAVPISYSNYFDGTGDELTTTTNAVFTFGTGDFTIEMWVYVTANPGDYAYFYAQGPNTSASMGLYLSAGKINVWNGSNIIVGSTTYSLNRWYHVALSRTGTSLKLFLDGVQDGSATNSSNITTGSTYGSTIARWVEIGDSRYFAGYISNLRVVKGTAVYTSAFTPSTTPLTAIANTSLLTCQSTRMIDNSTNAFTITAAGDVKPSIFNPFGYTAQTYTSYTPSLHGGSAYFDGTGDGLVVPSNSGFQFGSGNFTIECWVYLNAYGTTGSVFLGPWGNTGGSNRGWVFGYINTGTSLAFTYSTTGTDSIGVSGTYPLALKTWYHLAAVRNGNSITVYSNGILVGTASTSATLYTNTTNLYIGQNTEDGVLPTTSNNFSFNGHISDVRIVKGFAIYTSNFVPPTQTLTNYSTTNPASLLLNFTNGGIIDQHSTNVLETVGGAQLSTAVKKYGSASMYFDGTGDYLKIPNSQNFNFGSGNFTVEGWVYCTNTSSRQDIFTTPANASGFNGLSFAIYNGNFELTMSWTGGWDILFATAGSVSANTWYHFAVVRNGGTVTVYINGTSTYSNSGLSTSSLVFGTDPATISYGRVNQSDARYLYGYIDDLRITKGYARYTANFTAPTSALHT